MAEWSVRISKADSSWARVPIRAPSSKYHELQVTNRDTVEIDGERARAKKGSKRVPLLYPTLGGKGM